MAQYTRDEMIRKLQAEVDAKRPIIISGCGVGLAGKAADEGGTDIIGVYHSSYYRWARCVYNNYRISNNELVLRMTRDMCRVTKNAAVVAGVLCNDPTTDFDRYFEQLKEAGASGVMAFPTVVLNEGYLRDCQEDAGIGLDFELDNLRKAREHGLFTISYALNYEEHVEKIVSSGVDLILMHMGHTKGGIKPKTESDDQTLADCVERINHLYKVAKDINPDVFVLAHGGAISAPADTEYIYAHTKSIGFLGASSVERIPVERPIIERVRALKAITR